MAITRLYGAAALALLLSNDAILTSVNALVQVCGSDYADATQNCRANPTCPNGDGCPGDKNTCYALPESQCFSPPTTAPPTLRPSVSPTPAPLRVCGMDYGDALSGCRSNPYCPNYSCPVGTACFTIPVDICPTPNPTESPTPVPRVCGLDIDAAMANCENPDKDCRVTGRCGIGEACFTVPPQFCGLTSEPTPEPTESPIPEPDPRVCAVDVSTAKATCPDMWKRCPTAGCPFGEACFTVQKSECGVVESPPDDFAPIGSAVATAKPTEAPVESFLSVCGRDWGDVSTNCRTNPTCPTGDGCPMGMTCYSLPPGTCPEPATPGPTTRPTFQGISIPTAPKMTIQPTPPPTTAPITESPTADPTMKPTEVKVPTAPTEPPTPANMFVCGPDYTNVAQNYCTNPKCPSGGGCANGWTCFALLYNPCDATSSPSSAPNNAESEPTSSPSTSPPTMSPSDYPSSSPSSSPTNYPTGSPIFNIFFCGATYKLAEENCWTAERCPSGSGCSKPGEQCYGISLPQCLSPEPTGVPTGPGPRPSASPTGSSAPTSPPTMSVSPTELPTPKPSESPIVNTLFCGASYGEAVDGCSEATACSGGGGCPGGTNCFTGITCAAMETPGDNASQTPGITFPITPEPTSSPAPTASPVPTPSPAAWWELVGLTSPPTPNNRFCGVTAQDAADRCATTAPCPDGFSTSCSPGETCFMVETCLTAGGGSDAGGIDGTTPIEFFPAPTPNPTGEHVFDPDATSFCGTNWSDALTNCYKKKPCPTGAKEECPDGQNCFTGIDCETPPPTMSLAPTSPTQMTSAGGTPGGTQGGMPGVAPGGVPGATSSPTKKPTNEVVTPRPSWNLDFEVESSGGSRMLCSITKSAIVSGFVLGAFAIF